MIIKNLSVKSASGVGRLLNYMHNSLDRLKDADGKSFVLRHHLRGENPEVWAKEFAENEQNRLTHRSDSVYAQHVIMSFHAEDSPFITQDVLEDFAQQYVGLAAEDALVIAVPHHDRDHLHVHLCISGIDRYEGKSTRISKQVFADVKTKLQEFQKERYPELTHSLVRHGKKKEINQVRDTEQEFDPRTKKERVIQETQELLQETSSLEEFIDRLTQKGIDTYDRGGTIQGIVVDNKKYRLKRSLGIDLQTWEWKTNKEPNHQYDGKLETKSEPKEIEETSRQRTESSQEQESNNKQDEPRVHEHSPNPESENSKEPLEQTKSDPQVSSRNAELSSIRERKEEPRELGGSRDGGGR